LSPSRRSVAPNRETISCKFSAIALFFSKLGRLKGRSSRSNFSCDREVVLHTEHVLDVTTSKEIGKGPREEQLAKPSQR
jgi:hypothetical protein